MPEYILHTVKKGETVWELSKKYKVEEHKIVQANPEKIKLAKQGNKYTPIIYEGDVLKIPQQQEEETETFTIKGNTSVGMGKTEEFELLTREGEIPRFLPEKIYWIFSVEENEGYWRKLKLEKEKTGQKFSVVFTNQKLKAKKIQIEAFLKKETGEEKLSELIVILDGEDLPEIKKLELLDANRNKIKRALSYAETLYARAQCTGMEGETLYFSLWEDDTPGAGHSKENEENFIATKQAEVINGLAEVSFSLMYSTMAPIANRKIPKGQKDEGKHHEYYVTVTRYEASEPEQSSENINVNNPDYIPPPPKPKPKKQEPSQPKKAEQKQPQVIHKDKINAPATPPASAWKEPKIIKVYFRDTQGKEWKRRPKYGEKIRVYIQSENLIGKKINLKLYDKDTMSDDLLYDKDWNINAKLNQIEVELTQEMQDKGGDVWYQNIFAEVSLYDTKQTVKSEVIDVDKTDFSVPKPEGIKVVTINKPKQKKEEKEKCFCNRDFKEKDVRQFVKLLKGSETIWEGQALKGGKRAECNISDKSFATLTKELNDALKKYKINTCAQKMHFLAQVCEETGTFTLSEETKSQYASSTSFYKGRGILQLTGVKKKGEDKYNAPGPYQDYADYKRDQDIIKKPEIVANNVHYCIDSGAWIWSISKKMPTAPSKAVDRWGIETSGKSLNELATYADKYLELISVLLNGRNTTTNMPNGWVARQSIYNKLKTEFFFYERFHKEKQHPKATAQGIITYHIYSGGKIEKHIPKEIKLENKKKYKYVFHKNNKEHVLGVFGFKLTKEMNKGNIAGKNDVELIDIREFKSYYSVEVKLKFLTLNTESKRFYINPNCYAGLLGAMADMNIDYLGFNGFSNYEAKSTGGSSSHRNGEKGDLRYLSKNRKGEATILQDSHFDVINQNKFNDVLYSFGWGRLEKMYSEYFNYNGNKNYLLNHTKHMRKDGPKGYRHHHHLHLTGFNHSLIKVIKEQ